MRTSSLARPAVVALLAGTLAGTLAVACAPRGDDAPASDTAPATVSPAAGPASGAAPRDTLVPGGTHDSLRAAPAAPSRGATGTRAADSGRVVRPTPPEKAPGGTILLPPRTHDSLRAGPPTSTRP